MNYINCRYTALDMDADDMIFCNVCAAPSSIHDFEWCVDCDRNMCLECVDRVCDIYGYGIGTRCMVCRVNNPESAPFACFTSIIGSSSGYRTKYKHVVGEHISKYTGVNNTTNMNLVMAIVIEKSSTCSVIFPFAKFGE